jgi:hypothetical protein
LQIGDIFSTAELQRKVLNQQEHMFEKKQGDQFYDFPVKRTRVNNSLMDAEYEMKGIIFNPLRTPSRVSLVHSNFYYITVIISESMKHEWASLTILLLFFLFTYFRKKTRRQRGRRRLRFRQHQLL